MKPRRIIFGIVACAVMAILLAALVAWRWHVRYSPIEVDLVRPGSVGDVSPRVRQAVKTGPWSPPREVTIRVDERVCIHDMLFACDVVERPGRNDEVIAITEPLTLVQLKQHVQIFASALPSELLSDDAHGFSRAAAIAQATTISDEDLPLIAVRVHTHLYVVEVVIRRGVSPSTFVLQYVVEKSML